jgi:beta-lactamase regulating signal transducer with metallopeptidase domain
MAWLSAIASNVALASCLALAAWYLQRRLGRPAVARVVWILVLVKLVTPPLVNVSLVELPASLACTLGVCNCHHTGMLATVVVTLPWILFATWTAGAGATLFTAWHRWSQLQRLLTHANPAPAEWQALAALLSSRLSIGRAPELLVTSSQLPPLVVPSWRRPRIVLPMALLDRLNVSQREALLLHELVHIQRRDHLVRMLELAISIVYWWLPAINSIGRQLRVCEETSCDAAVVSHLPQARRDYARLLLDVVDFSNPLPQRAVSQATTMSAVDGLEQRLRGILSVTPGTRRTWPVAVLPIGLACAILPCGVGYDFVGGDSAARPTLAAKSDACDLTATATHLSGGDHTLPRFAAYCCPQ